MKEGKSWTDTQTKDRVKMHESRERLCGEDLNKPEDSVHEEEKESSAVRPWSGRSGIEILGPTRNSHSSASEKRSAATAHFSSLVAVWTS